MISSGIVRGKGIQALGFDPALDGVFCGQARRSVVRRSFTPRYDYNQIMYRLALDDPRLTLPVAVYPLAETNGATRLVLRDEVETAGAWDRLEGVAFFALPPIASGVGLQPVYAAGEPGALTTNAPARGAQPRFVGLPLAEADPAPGLDGLWQWHTVADDGSDARCSFRLLRDGESVRTGGLSSDGPVTGSFRDRQLILELNWDGRLIRFEGRLQDQALTGTWHQPDGPLRGTWTARRLETRPAERTSPALVVLREYRNKIGGRSYTTAAEPPPGYEADGRPLCRVWRVPGTVFTLDRQARPLPVRRN